MMSTLTNITKHQYELHPHHTYTLTHISENRERCYDGTKPRHHHVHIHTHTHTRGIRSFANTGLEVVENGLCELLRRRVAAHVSSTDLALGNNTVHA